MRVEVKESKLFWGAAAGAALTAIGSFGPWARAVIVTVSGLDMDGWIALIGAGVAGFALFQFATRAEGRFLIASAVGGAMALAIAAYRASQIFGNQSAGEDSFFGDVDLLTPGWGLFMTLIGSSVLIVASGLLWFNGPPEHVPAPRSQEGPAHPGEPGRSEHEVPQETPPS